MKKIVLYLISAVCILAMLSVWPFCLVRRTEGLHSRLGVEYEYTQQPVTTETPYMQSFIAQTARLDFIEFTLGGQNGLLPEEGNVLFSLLNEEGKTLKSATIPFAEMKDATFYKVPIEQWVEKGAVYAFRLSVEENYNSPIYGVYTENADWAAPGSAKLQIGETEITGQGVASFGYGVPLNIKNVLCLWGFLTTVLLFVWIEAGQEYVPKQWKKENKITVLYRKAWRILGKYQGIILWLEFAGLIAATIYICRNKALDWDEAYTIQMLTKYSFAEMIQVTASDIHPPLYYVLLRGFAAIFGNAIFTLKVFSVLCTGGTMLLGILVIRRYWGAKAAFLFNLAVAFGPEFIYFSVNIRMYSMMVFFVMCCILLAHEILLSRKTVHYVLFVISALCGAFTHYFTVVPLAFIYLYLLIGLLRTEPKEWKKFLICCIATVLGYLPWLSVVVSSFKREGSTGTIDVTALDFRDLREWLSATNIEFSEYMPMILFVLGVVVFVWKRKQYEMTDRMFLATCAGNLFVSYFVCRLIASANEHFWNNRYILPAAGLFWLFLIILYVRKSRILFCTFSVWLVIMVLSSFQIQMVKELGTVEYMEATYATLEQVEDESVILYDYSTYDVLYASHLPGKEFIFIEDVDFETLPDNHIYFIAWAGSWFSQEDIEKYHIQAQDCGTMRFEEGVAGVKLYRINFEKR